MKKPIKKDSFLIESELVCIAKGVQVPELHASGQLACANENKKFEELINAGKHYSNK